MSIAHELRLSSEAATTTSIAMRRMLQAIEDRDWFAAETHRFEAVTNFESQLDHLIAANRMHEQQMGTRNDGRR